jgi:hypothetical protein
MRCPNCGAENDEGAPVCRSCSLPLPAAEQPPRNPVRPPTHLAVAIVSCILCCLPAGILAIAYAAQVSSRYDSGDYVGASDCSRKAKLWALASLGLGVIIDVMIAFVLLLAYVAHRA